MLYGSFTGWCEENGLKPASTVTLGRRLGERGYHSRQSNGKRYWRGLALLDAQHNDYARAKGGY